jgi:hypothetical protein
MADSPPAAAGIARLYSYSSCGTCRKAMAWLRQRGFQVEPIDITDQPPSESELRTALQPPVQHQRPELSGPWGPCREGDG